VREWKECICLGFEPTWLKVRNYFTRIAIRKYLRTIQPPPPKPKESFLSYFLFYCFVQVIWSAALLDEIPMPARVAAFPPPCPPSPLISIFPLSLSSSFPPFCLFLPSKQFCFFSYSRFFINPHPSHNVNLSTSWPFNILSW